ncbi:MAG: hypothetical protein FH748_07525 [Balneolaceae bacterium]|nr:hypothetical protein [Balneolaceae bacterium]
MRDSYFPGGKGLHVAYALRELGLNTTLLGVWGGITGEWLRNKTQKKNIDTLGPSVNGWSRICITNDTSTSWNETEILGAGPSLSDSEVADFTDTYHSYIKQKRPTGIIISGSTPAGFTPNIYSKMVKAGKRHKIPVYVDAKDKLLKNTLNSRPFAIHVNKDEGYELCGHKNPVEMALWLQSFCKVAAVTAGKQGLYLAYKNAVYHGFHRLPQNDIISTVGSGDCLLAGLYTGIQKFQEPEDWVRLATACGSANCINPDLGMLRAENVQAFTPQITIETISA